MSPADWINLVGTGGICAGVFFVATMAADLRTLTRTVADHESRLRGLEKGRG